MTAPTHHLAWLSVHPERSAQWLKRMLEEGFQVHHIDGDHSNDHPANLALIENVDHMRLHGLFGLDRPGIRLAASKGGKARMAKLTAKERSDNARRAGTKRWVAHRKRMKAARQAVQPEVGASV